MISAVLPFLSLVALGAAQSSSTVSLFIPFANPQSLFASIAGSDATATSYVVNCPDPKATVSSGSRAFATGFYDIVGHQDACGFDSAFTVVQGPSTVHYVLSVGDNTESFGCKLMGSTQAICVDSMTGLALRSSQPPVETASFYASEITFFPVTITAGSANANQTGSKTASPSPTPKTTASTTTSTQTGASSMNSVVAQSTNAAVLGSPAQGAGLLGALGAAVAGAML